jgi:hypothetical protein
MLKSGKKDRSGRLTQRGGGGWGTTSQDLLFLAGKLFRLSEEEASSSTDQNCSGFVYAGMPLLLSAVHSFIIEYEGMLNLQPLSHALTAPNGLAVLLESRYCVSGDLLDDLRDMIEIRNEIIHPVPLPVGTPDNWPDYLRHVKERGLLCTTGDPNADFIMFSQIRSHKLFQWAVGITELLYANIVNSNATKAPMFQRFVRPNFKTLFG